MENIARIAKLASEQEEEETSAQLSISSVSSTTSVITSTNNNDKNMLNGIESTSTSSSSNSNDNGNGNDNRKTPPLALDIMKVNEIAAYETQDTFAQLLKATMDKQSEATIGTYKSSHFPYEKLEFLTALRCYDYLYFYLIILRFHYFSISSVSENFFEIVYFIIL